MWITGALVPTGTRLPVWAAALVVDLAAPIAGYRTPGLGRSKTTDWDIEGVHFAERFQAFIIIALGESIVRTGATASSHGLTSGVVASLAVASATTAVLWWLYFGYLGPVLGYVQQLAGWHPGRPAGVVELRITHAQLGKERQEIVSWLVSGCCLSGAARRRSAASLVARSASRYWSAVAGSACPSQRAMTARSTPDCGRCIAQGLVRSCAMIYADLGRSGAV